MDPISKEYLLLFNAVTGALEDLERLRRQLLEAQQQAEALYIAGDPESPDGRSA